MVQIFKKIVLSLIFALSLSLFAIGPVFALYDDDENSEDNVLFAGILDFYLTSPQDFTPNVIIPGETSTRNIAIINDNGNPFKYNISSVKTSGDDDFCNILELEAKKDGVQKYSGNLMGLNLVPPAVIDGDGEDSWEFLVTMPKNAPSDLENKTCQFKFVFEGWQVDMPDSSLGFYDTEEILNNISTGDWYSEILITKVYYDVCDYQVCGCDVKCAKTINCGESKGREGKNEWIELYNPNNFDVNIKKWEICDKDDCRTINPNKSIPANGFALMSHDNSTWTHYWNVPDDVVKINLGVSWMYLNNDNDMLVLKDKSGYIVDQMNWGTPDPTWTNANFGLWNPGAVDVIEGHMLGRIPLNPGPGYQDTDTPADWREYDVPEITILEPMKGYIWHIGGVGEIRWEAKNPNGPDSDLLINIFYSADDGATWANIIKETENDGKYDWDPIPLYLTDEKGKPYYVPSPDARIKIVAIGPENFMIKSEEISDKFCPPVDDEIIKDNSILSSKKVDSPNLKKENDDAAILKDEEVDGDDGESDNDNGDGDGDDEDGESEIGEDDWPEDEVQPEDFN